MADGAATNDAERGRENLRAWEASKPHNFFASDQNLITVLRQHLGEDGYAAVQGRLWHFGEQCATSIDAAAKQEDLIGNHPKLQRYDGIGQRREAIEFHPNHHLNGALIWEAGMMALQADPGNNVTQMALFYLLNHNGEAGHACSIACTAGLIRALQTVAEPAVRDRFLPPLVEQNYARMQHGAQFLTEVQGGSDVGMNSVQACDNGDGTWRVSGEKWFCSNINADQFLVMARPEGAPDGTRGLGAFLIPRLLDTGETNGFYLRRMKEKLGTRTMASAEVDFVNAVAYPIGPVDSGFKTTVELVLNTSRLLNAVACAGIMRRAYLEASTYACTRVAFGQPIIQYPLVQETLADLLSENYAATASGFALAHLLDRIETGLATEDDRAVYRVLVNLNKYITSVRGTEAVHQAIEVLGGNGAIETFSILPRLYRDMVVLESWEGTHNVLCLQVMRDILRYGFDAAFIRFAEAKLDGVTILPDAVHQVRASLELLRGTLSRLLREDPQFQQAHARRLADLMAQIAQAALLLREAQWEHDHNLQSVKQDVVTHFVNRRLTPAYAPLDDPPYLERLARIAQSA